MALENDKMKEIKKMTSQQMVQHMVYYLKDIRTCIEILTFIMLLVIALNIVMVVGILGMAS